MVNVKPFPPEYLHGKIRPSTKWARLQIILVTQQLHTGRQLKMSSMRKTEKWVRPGEVIAKVSMPADQADTSRCCQVRAGPETVKESGPRDPLQDIEYGPDLPPEIKKKFEAVYQKYRKVFEESKVIPELKNFEYTIMEPADLPPVTSRPMRMTPEKEDALIERIEALERAGVLEPSPPSKHCARAFLVKKKEKNTFRFVADFSKISKFLPPDKYPTATTNDVKQLLSESYLISALDVKEAFHCVRLAPESRHLTAFSAQSRTCRKFLRYKRLPMGLSISTAAMARAFSQIFGDLERTGQFIYFVDDAYVVSKGCDYDQHLELLAEVLRRCEEHDLRLSPKKVKAGFRKLKALGWTFNCPGVSCDDEKVKAILEMPYPKTFNDLRSFYGLACFFKTHIPNFDEVVQPMVDLLKPKFKHRRDFMTPEALQAVDKFRELLTSAPVLQPYVPGDQVLCATDASLVGISYHVMQVRKETGNLVTLAYGAKSLTKTEKTYPINLLELMACAYAVTKHPEYFRAQEIHMITDHKGILNFDTYRSPSTKINRLLSILADYNIVYHHVAGERNKIADHLSRYPPAPTPNEKSASEILEVYKIKTAQEEIPLSQQIRTAQKTDQWCQDAKKFIEEGVLPAEQRYANKIRIARKHLSVQDGLVCHSHKNNLGENTWTVVVPQPVRKKVMTWGHQGHMHQGQKETLRTIRDVAFWPSLRHDVHRLVSQCRLCAKVKRGYAKAPAGALRPRTPKEPWEMVSVDWVGELPMTKNRNRYFLIVQDLFSRWVEIIPTPTRSTERAIKILDCLFARTSFPAEIISDYDTIFRSQKWQDACTRWGAVATTSPPYKQRANRCERAVQDAKVCLRFQLFDKSHARWDEDIPAILLQLRNRVNETTGYSPAQIIYGRNIRLKDHREFDLSPAQTLSIDHWMENYQEKIEAIRENALKRSSGKQENYLKKINAGRDTEKSYSLGDTVWVRHRPQSDAAKKFTAGLDTKYRGPAEVTAVLSNEVVMVKENGRTAYKVHIEDLKPCVKFEGSEAEDSHDETEEE